MGEDWSLSKLLFLQKHWEWESTRVLSVNLFDFDSTVRQEVVQDVVFITTIVGLIFPQDVESENFSVTVQETLEVLVWSSTLKHNFKVFLNLSLVWWNLLHVNHSSCLSKQVLRVVLISIKLNTFIGKESSGEIITADDSEYSLVDVEVLADVQISPVVVLGLIFWIWELMSLQENSLWNS